MIDLYTWTTPNGRKASIALEELGLPYTTHPIDIGKDEQFKPEFLRISPNNRIPAMVDRENGISLMESGAILIYFANVESRQRWITWLNSPDPANDKMGKIVHLKPKPDQPHEGPCNSSLRTRLSRISPSLAKVIRQHPRSVHP